MIWPGGLGEKGNGKAEETAEDLRRKQRGTGGPAEVGLGSKYGGGR